MFTRRGKGPESATEAVLDDPAGDEPGGKGRPTPKRRDAERERRERIRPPRDSKVAARQRRERKVQERRAMREGMVRGDERYLPLRDQGPKRRFIRDFIDSKLTAAEFFLPGAMIVLVLSLLPSPAAQGLAVSFWGVMIVVIVFDSLFLCLRLRRAVAERFPDERRRGTMPYALMRAMTWRSLRTPKPQLPRGAKP